MKRPWTCIALLSLIPSTGSGFSQDTPKNQQAKIDLDPLQQAITTPAPTSTSRRPTKNTVVDRDLFAQVVIRKKKRRKQQPQKKNRRNKSSKTQTTTNDNNNKSPAPFVDSTLLRFISQQKKQSEATGLPPQDPLLRPYTIPQGLTAEDDAEKQDEVVVTRKIEKNPALEYLEGLQQRVEEEEQQQQQQEEASTVAETSTDINGISGSTETQQITTTNVDPIISSSSSWDMGQYNANRVAKLLLEDGINNCVPESLAMQAGMSVQSHVMKRTARRRVRDFLKQRDQMWVAAQQQQQQQQQQTTSTTTTTTTKKQNGGPSSSSSNTATTTTASSEQAAPSYGIKDVLRLLREKGLTTNDVAVILCHTPSIALMRPTRQYGEQQSWLKPDDDDVNGEYQDDDDNENNHQQLLMSSTSGGETLEETMERAFQHVLTDSLRLRKTMARKVLRSCPGMLTMRGSKRAEEVLTLLLSLGVSTIQMGKDPNGLPALLSRSPSALFRLVSFLTSDAIRMPVKSIGPMLRRRESRELLNAVSPNLLFLTNATTDASTTATPLVEDTGSSSTTSTTFLEDALWVSDSDERRKKIDKVYQRMKSTAWTLRNRIGTKHLTDVVLAYPSVLLLNADDKILPNAVYLIQELGIWEDDLPKVLRMFPTLLGTDTARMQQVVDFLRSLQIPDNHLAIIFKAFPKLLTMDVEEKMIPVATFLAEEVGVANLGKFVARLPPILGYSIDRELRPKWDYLCKVCMHPVFEVSRFPAYFSYPFEKRIKTRYEYLRFVKKNTQTPLMAVDAIVRYGDEDFATYIAKDKDGGKLLARYIAYRDSKLASRREQQRRRKTNNAKKQQQQEIGKRLIAGSDDKQQEMTTSLSNESGPSEEERPSRRRRPPRLNGDKGE